MQEVCIQAIGVSSISAVTVITLHMKSKGRNSSFVLFLYYTKSRESAILSGKDGEAYDIRHPETPPPWKNNINKSIVSCDKLYTTEDGQDLLIQLVRLLQYAGQNKLTVTLV